MNNKFKEIDQKSYILLFDDIINTKHFHPNKIKIYEKSYKSILNCLLYWIHDNQRPQPCKIQWCRLFIPYY